LPFLEWYSQIIGESLGKDGKGYTPLKGLGPNDQHSMLQLYLEGPQDKFFSFFYLEKINPEVGKYKTINLNKFGYLAHKELSDINKANFTATINALSLKKLPIRSIILKELSSEAFGAMVCHLMLETITIGHLTRVNPFNQPGVEMIKIRSKELISNL
jgi:glucose-6-phosphate isomerase